MERDCRPPHLIEVVGDLSYEVTGGVYEHVAHSVIEQMLSMKVGRAIEGRLRGICGGEITCLMSVSVRNSASPTRCEPTTTSLVRARRAIGGSPVSNSLPILPRNMWTMMS